MYKYFVSFTYIYQSEPVFGLPPPRINSINDDTIVELNYKINSEETLDKLKKELKDWKIPNTPGHIHIKSLTLLS